MEKPRNSLHVCFGDQPITLFDEYERQIIENQLNKAMLRRSFSEPSPVRLAMIEIPIAPPMNPSNVTAMRRLPKLSRALKKLLRQVFGLEHNGKRVKASSKSFRA
ncbi:hypothetical protein IHE45_09G060600 [Dioscorea alata]|uniref:Uncharacterized protein n=1 Tax=Dioscorea alata TaxID=55571 RepID=A0ACB7VF83_DIOAL|nr:hypothetical protein IHE45_09G060600 [Dioscorea alata]